MHGFHIQNFFVLSYPKNIFFRCSIILPYDYLFINTFENGLHSISRFSANKTSPINFCGSPNHFGKGFVIINIF